MHRNTLLAAGLHPSGSELLSRAGATLRVEDVALRHVVEASDARQVTFAYMPDQAPVDECSDPTAEEWHDAEWPEIQRHPDMPHPYYHADISKSGIVHVDTRLMDPRPFYNPATGQDIRFINRAVYSISRQRLALKESENSIFTTSKFGASLKDGTLEPAAIVKGIGISLRMLRFTYPAGMHGFWDVE